MPASKKNTAMKSTFFSKCRSAKQILPVSPGKENKPPQQGMRHNLRSRTKARAKEQELTTMQSVINTNELLTEILRHLDLHQLNSARRVSKAWNGLIAAAPILQNVTFRYGKHPIDNLPTAGSAIKILYHPCFMRFELFLVKKDHLTTAEKAKENGNASPHEVGYRRSLYPENELVGSVNQYFCSDYATQPAVKNLAIHFYGLNHHYHTIISVHSDEGIKVKDVITQVNQYWNQHKSLRCIRNACAYTGKTVAVWCWRSKLTSSSTAGPNIKALLDTPMVGDRQFHVQVDWWAGQMNGKLVINK